MPTTILKATLEVHACNPVGNLNGVAVRSFVYLLKHGVCRFECKSDGTYLDIQHVSLELTDEEPADSAYTGPVSLKLVCPCELHLCDFVAACH